MLRSMLVATLLVGLQGVAFAQTPEISADAPEAARSLGNAAESEADAGSSAEDPAEDGNAQGEDAEDGDKGDGDAKEGEGGSASGGGSRFKPLPGDVVELKNGKSITGIQVLRETPVHVEIVTAPGEPPLRIPRKQVKDVVYDDVDPNRLPPPAPVVPELPDVMEGNELQPEFHAKLTKPLSDQPIVFENTDIVAMMRDLRGRADVALVLLPGVHNTPVEQRQWTVTIPPGTPLMAVLQQDFTKQFPQFQVIFEYARVVIKTEQDVLEPAGAAPQAPATPAPSVAPAEDAPVAP